MARPRRPKKDSEPVEMGGVNLIPGSRIGSYIFLREVGAGGMARVLLARDPDGEMVALKVLKRSRFKTGLVRFRREFRSLSRIRHPNVVRVESFGDLHGHPYFAMEYVEGIDLHALIRSFRGWEPEKRWARCEAILVDLCRALSAIHRIGLVHRDLKPSNVLVDGEGRCKLTDFGIVKDLDPNQDAFLSTTLVGTWAYASPEQITGQPIDNRSDLYSLGVILFAMLTSKRPFVASDMAGYLEQHRDHPAPAPRDVNPRVPAHLDEICRRLLQKAPSDRFQSAQEILYRLEAEDKPTAIVGCGRDWTPPMVGRHLEIELLSNSVSRLTDGRGGVVVLEGDDGAGKSRLLRVGAELAKNLGFSVSRFEFNRSEAVLSGLLRVARSVSKLLGDATPKALGAALAQFGKSGTPRGNVRYALYDGMRDAYRVLATDRPLVILVDELHEGQPREIDFMVYLVRTLLVKAELPILFIVTSRSKANPSADAFANGEGLEIEPIQFDVGPLSREDLQRVVVDLVGDSLEARLLAQRLHNETEGNAYFFSEFMRNLMSTGVITGEEGRRRLTLEADEITMGHLDIPVGVRTLMKSRLEGLPVFDRRILDMLAISERELELDVLLDVLDEDEDEVLDGLDRLLAAGIIRERRAGEVIFYLVTHRKFTDVVYRDMVPEDRARLHREMAAALEMHFSDNSAGLEIVGDHYRRAGDSGKAYTYLVAAAKRLNDRSLSQEAWDLTEKAGSLEDKARDELPADSFRSLRSDNLRVRSLVHYNRAEWRQAEKGWRVVLKMAEDDSDPMKSSEASLQLATCLRRQGRHRESQRHAAQALELARRLHFREGVADALHCLAALAWAKGDLDTCERLANEGLLVAQGSTFADRRAELLLALTVAQATRGHLAAAISGLKEAECIFRDLRKKRSRCLALANLAELLTWQGEPVQARQRAHVAVQVANELDYKLGGTAATRAMAVAALDLGRYDEASSLLHAALKTARQIDLPEEIVACLCALTRHAVETGDMSQARLFGADGIEVAERRDPERYMPLIKAHLARSRVKSGPKEAWFLLKSAAEALESLPIPRRTQVQLVLAWNELELGEFERARIHASAVLQVAGARGFRLMRIEARAILAHVCTGDEQDIHREAGQSLARAFSERLSKEMAPVFQTRPFLRYLEQFSV